jgi:hypothetical protein
MSPRNLTTTYSRRVLLGSSDAKDASAVWMILGFKQAGNGGFCDLDTHTVAEVPASFRRGDRWL